MAVGGAGDTPEQEHGTDGPSREQAHADAAEEAGQEPDQADLDLERADVGREQHAPDQAGPRRGFTPLAAALLAVMIGLAVGFAAGVFVAKPSYPGEDSPEAGFARDMSTHHGQAVEMGMIAWQRATSPKVRQLAYDITITQKGQMGIMLNWLQTWDVPLTSPGPPMAWMDHGEDMVRDDGLMVGMATREQLDELRAAKGKQVDILFCKLMIDHHIGGVHMAEGAVELSDRPEVVELAQGMIDAQDSEIKLMRKFLAELGAQ